MQIYQLDKKLTIQTWGQDLPFSIKHPLAESSEGLAYPASDLKNTEKGQSVFQSLISKNINEVEEEGELEVEGASKKLDSMTLYPYHLHSWR